MEEKNNTKTNNSNDWLNALGNRLYPTVRTQIFFLPKSIAVIHIDRNDGDAICVRVENVKINCSTRTELNRSASLHGRIYIK